jgi:hypothetical protein
MRDEPLGRSAAFPRRTSADCSNTGHVLSVYAGGSVSYFNKYPVCWGAFSGVRSEVALWI